MITSKDRIKAWLHWRKLDVSRKFMLRDIRESEEEMDADLDSILSENEEASKILLPFPGSTLVQQAQVRMAERTDLEAKYQKLLPLLWAVKEYKLAKYRNENVAVTWHKVTKILGDL